MENAREGAESEDLINMSVDTLKLWLKKLHAHAKKEGKAILTKLRNEREYAEAVIQLEKARTELEQAKAQLHEARVQLFGEKVAEQMRDAEAAYCSFFVT